MKNIIILGFIILMFMSCFEDEGNYTYSPVLAPVFTFEDPQYLECYGGDTAKLDAAFYFEKDSVERLANVRYEWKLNGVVLSEERNFCVPTDTIMKKLGMTTYPDENGLWGTFNVIEKATGVSYMAKILFDLRPKFWKGQWLILSENGSNAKLTYLSLKKKAQKNKIDSIYTIYADIYEQSNNSVLPGKPIRLIDHVAKNISVAVGATLVVTNQVAYELNNENFIKATDLKEQFLDNAPQSPIVDAYYANEVTFVATAEGKLYKRTFTTNWLGGKFIPDPYTIDAKGYSITAFGKGLSVNNSAMFPCYDELNRRVITINQWGAPFAKLDPVVPVGNNHPLSVWDMENGVEVLHVAEVKDVYAGRGLNVFCILFNQNGHTYMSDFVLQTKSGEFYANCMENENANLRLFPGGLLNRNTKILLSANARENLILYTRGNELRYVNRTNETDNLLMSFNAPITVLRTSSYNSAYNDLAVGLENGEFMLVNIKDMSHPYIIEKSRINLGGKVVDASQIGSGYHIE